MNLVYIFFSFIVYDITLATKEEEIEVILLPFKFTNNNNNITVPLSFTAFGKKVDLLLEKNENLLTKGFEVWKRDEDDILNKLNNFNGTSCYYLHKDSSISAAVSLCNSGTVHGFVFFENDSLEITPLSSEETNIFENHRIKVRSSPTYGEPHIIKRRRIPYGQIEGLDETYVKILSRRKDRSIDSENNENKTREGEVTTALTIELAVFFDATAYSLFEPYLSNDEARLLDLLLAYINNIQALYYHPSLGRRIDLALVRLELMQTQPAELAHLDGERGQVLDDFCAYSKKMNPIGDDDPRHWDMGLYISGLDFYALEDGKKNPVTMGLAPVGGVCWDDFACVITEFGVTNRFGKPYPSAGFTSVYVAAHEIAHNLGMHHDSVNNNCPKDGYIMSPSRGTQGETHWSTCSRALADDLHKTKPCLLDTSEMDYMIDKHRRLDHRGRFSELPGRRWTAKMQCEVLLREPDAYVDSLKNSCQALRCRSPTRTGFYLAGPALDGTKCAKGKECRAGECLPVDNPWQSSPSTSTPKPREWSKWRDGKCESGCIRGSMGYKERSRICLSDSGCTGFNFDVKLCKDNELCEGSSRKRVTVLEYASTQCLDFARKIDVIDGTAGGLQAEHEDERPWVACAIFCKRQDIASFYAPRIELNDLGIDPYFPDGTWCHQQEGENYYCRKHHCLPEKFRFGKGLGSLDEDLGPMNAVPRDWHLPPEVIKYFSLSIDGKPLLTNLEPRMFQPPRDGDPWLDSKDYVELPTEILEPRRIIM